MANDIEFIPGLVLKSPREGAPDFVKLRGSIKRDELIAYLAANTDEWINFDVKESKGGKLYAARDNWKPNQTGDRSQRKDKPAPAVSEGSQPGVFPDDDIPF